MCHRFSALPRDSRKERLEHEPWGDRAHEAIPRLLDHRHRLQRPWCTPLRGQLFDACVVLEIDELEASPECREEDISVEREEVGQDAVNAVAKAAFRPSRLVFLEFSILV